MAKLPDPDPGGRLRRERARARPATRRRRGRGRRALRALALAALALAAASAALVATLRFVAPPTSAFMVREQVAARLEGRVDWRVRYRWSPWADISPYAPLAVIAAEDQRFPRHRGFDLEALERAWAEYRAGGRLRGASTLSQQVAKNLFLWPGRSVVRKGLEAWLTVLIELMWPKRRILEVYLNIAQFGARVYGVEAAARLFFDKPAAALGADEAALLAAVLPNPLRFRVEAPSDYVLERRDWIRRQMRQLGGLAYLDRL